MDETLAPALPPPGTARTFSRTLAAAGALALLFLGVPAAAQIEPLTLRVADAEGQPGGTVAVVLRTYASRPVSQGRVCGGPRSPTQAAGSFRAALAVGPGSPFSAFDEDASRFFAADGSPLAIWTWTDATQTLDVDFSSATASINADDGVLAVFSFTLDAALAPGTEYEFAVVPAESFLLDPDGAAIPIVVRPGRLRVRSAATNPSLSIGAPKVHPGSGAELEIETAEPFALSSGRVEIVYDPAIADGVPSVRTDPRHGNLLSVDVSFPAAGRVRIDFTSDGSLNASVPGALFSVLLPTRRGTPIGATSYVQFEATQTFLVGPGPSPRPVNLPGDWIEFDYRPAIWQDAFEGGSLWVWSRRSP